jgi:pSer/pThr/pTyr-binding forkhead associated (FHA) protein
MQLVIYKDNAVIESIPLIPGEEYSAGRSNENDIVLESPSVSRSHARIRVIDTDSVTIEDVGSTNGTFLAGKKILETRWDNTDSIVLIGDYQLHLTLPREQKIEVIPEELPPREDPSPNNQITLPQQDTKKSFAKKSYQTFPYLIVTLLISLPFTVFAVRDHMALNSHMEKLFQVESKKAEQIWYVNKTQVLNNKLAKASKKLSSGNFQLAQVLLADVLKKDPGNIAAIALQVNIQKKLKLRDDKKSREREHEKKKNQTTQAQKNEQEIAKYIEAIRQDIDKKDYHACISKAG